MTKEEKVKLLARLKHIVNNAHLKPFEIYTEDEVDELLHLIDEFIDELCEVK